MNDFSPSVCALCGLSIPREPPWRFSFDNVTYRFCCSGCLHVFRMLAELSGAADVSRFRNTELFRQCRELGIIPGPPSESQSLQGPSPSETKTGFGFESEFDSDNRARREKNFDIGPLQNCEAPRKEKDRFLELSLSIGGMWCPACAWVISEVLTRQAGVAHAQCHFASDRLRCRYDPVKTSPEKIKKAIGRMGYTALEPGDSTGDDAARGELIRFAVSAFLSMNVMMLSIALYSGFFTDLSDESIRNLSWPILVLSTVVMVHGGKNIHRKGWAGWRRFGFTMETLISAGAITAYVYSLVNFFSGSLHLYFDTAAMLITLVLLGKLIENNARQKACRKLDDLQCLVPQKARIVTPEFPNGRYVSVRQLKPSDTFLVESSEIIAADGIVMDGTGAADESSLTGEATPVPKKAGSHVKSGTRLILGNLTVRVEAVGENAALGRMILLMQSALEKKTPRQSKTDMAMRWFVPIIFLLAVITGTAGYALGLTGENAMVRAVTVMVISCPCALGIAIPMARVAGMSLFAKNGLLLRDFNALDNAANIDTVIFDKTGTLTRGGWELLQIRCHPKWSRDKILSIAAALERDQRHPAAVKIIHHARKQNIPLARVEAIAAHPNGVGGIFEGVEVKIGSREFIFHGIFQDGKFEYQSSWNRPRASFPEDINPEGLLDADADTLSKIHMSIDGLPAATFFFGDRIKPGAGQTVKNLHEKGFSVGMISGDGEAVTKKVAKKLGIRIASGGMLPETKAVFIDSLRRGKKNVAMVGDGINDAPAMATADIALAIYAPGKLGRETAHVTLMRGDPGQVLDFFSLSKQVNRKIIQNLVFTFLYNAVGIPVAMAGLLSPLVAVCAMLCSSLTVIGNTLLLGKKRRRP